MGYTILSITADWHVNDLVALSPVPFRRMLKSTHRPGPLQLAIHSAWTDYWAYVSHQKSLHDATLVNLYLGDLGDLNKYSSSELVSTVTADVKNAMLDVSEPARALADHQIVIRGTEAHTGAAGELEEWFADDISAVPSPEGHASWFAFNALIGNVRVYAAHHPPSGTKMPDNRGQAVARCCKFLANEHHVNLASLAQKPQIAFWGHRHWYGHGEELGIEGWFCPSWKGIGSFGRRIGISTPSPVGGLILHLPGDGTWKVEHFTRQPPQIPAWTLPS